MKQMELKKHQASYLQYIEVSLTESNPNIFFDKTQIALSREICDLYEELKDDITEFLNIEAKNRKHSEMVVYIKLKLEIMRQSPLFRQIVKMQAGLESQIEVEKYVESKKSSRIGSFSQNRDTVRQTAEQIKLELGINQPATQSSKSTIASRSKSGQIKLDQVSTKLNNAQQPKMSAMQKLRKQLANNPFTSPAAKKKKDFDLFGSMFDPSTAGNTRQASVSDQLPDDKKVAAVIKNPVSDAQNKRL